MAKAEENRLVGQASTASAYFGLWPAAIGLIRHETENDVPHPHVLLACGFSNMNPRLSRLVS